jgi:hypothetical protein
MLRIIPEPKEVKKTSGVFKWNKNLKIFAGKAHAGAAKRLCSFLKEEHKINVAWEAQEDNGNYLLISEKFKAPKLKAIKKKQAYSLDISSSILIQGGDEAGVFYGVMTLIQMLEDGLNLPKAKINDEPAMKIRAEHWDLKGLMPKYSYLKKRILELSKYKINALLVEYEDKFAFDRHPVIVSKTALSQKQVKELVKIAKDNFIEVIPLIQCLGHAEYVLKHKEYSYLQETSDRCQQFCATNPKTMDIFKDFVEEISPLHPSKYIHVGGDETRQLGECPECAKVAKKKGVIGLYFDHTKKVCDYIVSLGKVPIIWDDMLCRNYRKDLLKKLPKETVIMPWLYGIDSERENLFFGPDHITPFSKEWLKKDYDNNIDMIKFLHRWRNRSITYINAKYYEDIPASEKKKYAKYVEIKDSPKHFNPVPAISLIKEAGLEYFGAGAIQASCDGKYMPHAEGKAANLKTWSKIVPKSKGIGLVGTAWARSGTLTQPNAPFDSRWHSVLAMAEHSWAGGKTDDKLYDEKFNWRMFGLDNLTLTDALFFLNAVDRRYSPLSLKMLEEVKKDVKRNKYIFDVIVNAAHLVRNDKWLDDVFNVYKNWLYQVEDGSIHKSQKNVLNRYIRELNDAAKKLEKDTRRLLSKTMPRQEVDEYARCVFSPMKNLLKRV